MSGDESSPSRGKHLSSLRSDSENSINTLGTNDSHYRELSTTRRITRSRSKSFRQRSSVSSRSRSNSVDANTTEPSVNSYAFRNTSEKRSRSRGKSVFGSTHSSPENTKNHRRGRSSTKRITRSLSKSDCGGGRGRSSTRRLTRSRSSSVDDTTSEISYCRFRGRSLTKKGARSKSTDGHARGKNGVNNSPTQDVNKGRENVKRRRGRPKKIRVAEESADEKDSQTINRRSSSTGRPKRNARKPRKLLSDSSEDFSEEEDDYEACSLKRHKLMHLDQVDSFSRENHRSMSTRSNSCNKQRRSSDSESTVTKDSPPSKLKKRKISPEHLPTLQGDKDIFCWQCHRHGNNMITCHICPRIYHKRCGKVTAPEPERWICLECKAAMVAGSVQNPSEVNSLTQEELNQMLRMVMERVLCQKESKHFKQPVDLNAYPSYTDYIVHPMDLSLVEKNINNNKYKTTESFVADMKWLLHNSHIFNSPYSELTTCAKRIVKTVKQEADEIDTCANCYFNYHSLDENEWFVEPCEKPHLLVWAKLRGFPYWPAKVMRVAHDLVDVRFFGDHNRSWLSPSACYLFSQAPPCVNKLGHTKDYNECLKEVFIHVKLLKDKFGKFVFATSRVIYEPDEHQHMLYEMLPQLESTENSRKTSFINKIVERDQDGILCKMSEKPSTALSSSPATIANKKSVPVTFDNTLEITENGVKLLNTSQTTVFTFEQKLQKVDKPFAQKNSLNSNDTVGHQVNENDEASKNSFENIVISDNNEEIHRSEIDQSYRESDDLRSALENKMPQVVLTRISIPQKDNISKKNHYSQLGSNVAEVSIKKLSDSAKATLSTSENTSQTDSIDLSNDGNIVKNPEPFNRIMLKVKSSAELLSSEALLKQKESLTVCKDMSTSKSEKNINLLPNSEVVTVSAKGSKQYHVSLLKINETIEKVIRGDISVTLPSRETKRHPGPGDTPNASSDLGVDESSLPEVETILDEEVQATKKGEKCTGEMFGFENQTVFIETMTDVSSWSGESISENTASREDVEKLFNKLEHSLNLDECKTYAVALKDLFGFQRNLVREMSYKMMNEANEIYDIFVNENEKISSQKGELDKAVSKIKLTQWCNLCLKEANFYCCWGTSYCSSDCQLKDWDFHIEYCKQSDIKNDKLRVANPGVSKSTLPAVTINKLPSTGSTASEVTITKTLNNSRPPFMAGKSQSQTQHNVSATLQKGTTLVPSLVKAKNSELVINKRLTSNGVIMPKNHIQLTSGSIIKNSSIMVSNNKNEAQKVYISTDQIKGFSKKVLISPRLCKGPLAIPSQIISISNQGTAVNLNDPSTSKSPVSCKSPNPSAQFLIIKKKEGCTYKKFTA